MLVSSGAPLTRHHCRLRFSVGPSKLGFMVAALDGPFLSVATLMLGGGRQLQVEAGGGEEAQIGQVVLQHSGLVVIVVPLARHSERRQQVQISRALVCDLASCLAIVLALDGQLVHSTPPGRLLASAVGELPTVGAGGRRSHQHGHIGEACARALACRHAVPMMMARRLVCVLQTSLD